MTDGWSVADTFEITRQRVCKPRPLVAGLEGSTFYSARGQAGPETVGSGRRRRGRAGRETGSVGAPDDRRPIRRRVYCTMLTLISLSARLDINGGDLPSTC